MIILLFLLKIVPLNIRLWFPEPIFWAPAVQKSSPLGDILRHVWQPSLPNEKLLSNIDGG